MKEVYIANEEKNLKSCNNHNTDKPDIRLAKPKQETQTKNKGELELRHTKL